VIERIEESDADRPRRTSSRLHRNDTKRCGCEANDHDTVHALRALDMLRAIRLTGIEP
jgi:hypothetical protein